MVVHSAHRLHMPSLLPADPPTPYLTPHNKLQCSILAILDTILHPRLWYVRSGATAVCPMHEAIMCLMLPLCVRCGRCVSDVATVCSMLVRCSI